MGLSSTGQNRIVQDNEGFIWVATDDGLNRFDGYKFKVYRKKANDSTSLQTNFISTVFVDSKGILWVGTYMGGLSRYNKYLDNFTNYFHNNKYQYSISNNVITYITEDSQHRIWIGTFEGLNLFDQEKNRFIRFNYGNGNSNSKTIVHPQVRSLTSDGDNLWIGYTNGLLGVLNLHTQQFTHYRLFYVSDLSVADFFCTSICVDGDSLWISTWGNGIWILNKKTGKYRKFDKIGYQFINFLCKDNKNKLWIGTESNGLLEMDDKRKRITQYQHDDYNKYSLSNNCISHIFQDKQGNLWLANKNGNIHYLITDNPFQVWRRNPSSNYGLSNDDVSCVLEDKNNKLWISYNNGGIDIFNPKKHGEKISIPGNNETGLGEKPIITLFQSRKGIIWVGTYLNGLKRYNESNGKFITYMHNPLNNNTIAANDIRKITEDNKGNLWIATHGGGLDQFNPETGQFIHYKVNSNTSKPINSNWLYTVFCDRENNIWTGSVAGISYISKESKKVIHYKNVPADKNSLSNDVVKVIFQDSRGFIWFGTNDGLNKLDRNKNSFRVYSVIDGLPNSFINGIIEDDHGNLWISTNKGLSCFIYKNETFKNYFIEDGLGTDEFRLGACFKNRLGEMYFGGREGLTLFHPDSIKVNTMIPPVYITDFRLFNQSVPVSNTGQSHTFSLKKQPYFIDLITLTYDQNVFSFEFAALNYLNLQKNQYTYIMEGFDKNWSKPDTRQEVTYTNLTPGTYFFRVNASNNDGIWNKTGASIKIVIFPPFWKTKWAYILYALIVVVLLYLFRKLTLRDIDFKRKLELEVLEVEKLQEMDRQKMRFFSNVSHEFRTPLTLIIGPLEKMIKTTQDKVKLLQLQLIYRNTNRLLRLINELMDLGKLGANGLKLKLTQNDIIKFINELSISFRLEARQRNIDFKVETNACSMIAWFDQDKLDKILFNIIANAFKFTSDGGKITIQVYVENNWDKENQSVKIAVKDTGIGIPAESIPKIFDRFYQVENRVNVHGTGIGLALTKELVQLHGGEILVESKVGTGSCFTIVLSLKKANNENFQIAYSANSNDNKEDNDNNSLLWNDSEISVLKQNNIAERRKLPLLLIVEDNPDMKLYIKNEFYDNYLIIEASDGLTGLEKAFAEIPDVIISDIMMPGIDGTELCKKLKADERTSHIPIVLITARTSENHTLEGLESGADDYLSKPFNASILKVKIKNLVESRRVLQRRFLKEPGATIKDISPTSCDEKFLKKAYKIVEENLNNSGFEAIDFALALGLSRAQLYRKINAVSGQSVKEFIRIIRLKKAADFLINTNLNISEVAFKLGFNSAAYFTKSFSDYFCLTPTKYIMQNKKKFTDFYTKER